MPYEKDNSYNIKLFSKWQSVYHFSRFFWIKKKLMSFDIGNLSILELGCFDGKILYFLKNQPKEYLGLDANWGHGLDIAKKIWKNKPFTSFQLCQKPSDIPLDFKWDIGICMETLEHIPEHMVDEYLYRLHKIIYKYFYITIPIERGFPFIISSITRIKELFKHYKIKDLIYSFLGKLDKVDRHEHKGFDDRIMINRIKKYFNIIKIEGIFLKTPIINMNLDIGIIAQSKFFI